MIDFLRIAVFVLLSAGIVLGIPIFWIWTAMQHGSVSPFRWFSDDDGDR